MNSKIIFSYSKYLFPLLMKDIIKTQQLKTGCNFIKPRVTRNVFEFKKNIFKLDKTASGSLKIMKK